MSQTHRSIRTLFKTVARSANDGMKALSIGCLFLVASWSSVVIVHASHCSLAWQEESEKEEEEEKEKPAPVAVAVNRVAANGMPTKEFITAAKQFVLEQAFEMYLNDLESVCELDEKQRRKLAVGAKGAVKKALAEWKTEFDVSFDEMMGARGLRRGNDSAVEESDEDAEPIVITSFDELDQNTLRMMDMAAMRGKIAQQSEPTEHKFWSQLVMTTLNDDQRTQYTEHCQARDDQFFHSLYEYFTSKVARELLLNDDQSERFLALIESETNRSKLAGYNFYEPDLMLLFQASLIDEKKMGEILTEQQMQKWTLMHDRVSHLAQIIDLND